MSISTTRFQYYYDFFADFSLLVVITNSIGICNTKKSAQVILLVHLTYEVPIFSIVSKFLQVVFLAY